MNPILTTALLLVIQVRVNPDAAILSDFQNRVADYMKLNKKIQGDTPLKPTDSRAAIVTRTSEFSDKVVQARQGAVQGDFFTPQIAKEFRRLVGIAMEGHRGSRIRKSLQHAEPSSGAVKVNTRFPVGIPMQSTPPTLLTNLPRLPPELDYRFVGGTLVLRDVQADLTLDFIPGVIQ